MLVEEIVNVQKKFFRTGTTRKIEYRLNSLQILKDGIHRMMPEIYAALKKDLGKCETESYMAEVGMTLAELSFQPEKKCGRLWPSFRQSVIGSRNLTVRF